MSQFFAVFLTPIFIVIACYGSALAEKNPFTPNMPSKNGHVLYEVQGGPQGDGKEEFFWRKNGAETVKITKTRGKIMGMIPVSSDTTAIMTPDTITTIDNSKNTASRMTNPQKFMIEEYNKLTSKEKAIVRENIEKMGLSMATQMGGTSKRKAGTHLGYTCDITNVAGIRVYVMSDYPAIVLKQEFSIAGMSGVTNATKLEKNISVPDHLFNVDAAIKVTHNPQADEMSENFARNIVTMMKDPEAAKKMEESIEKAKEEATQQRMQQMQMEQQKMPPQETSPGTSDTPPDDKAAQEEIQKNIQKGFDALKGLFN